MLDFIGSWGGTKRNMVNGGEWTGDVAAQNGHLKWIRANGGEWTSNAVDGAAENGHLETLKWIRANGGE